MGAHRLADEAVDPDDANVTTVMTPTPDVAGPETSVVEALWQMHDGRYLHIPVVTGSGEIVGVLDALSIRRLKNCRTPTIIFRPKSRFLHASFSRKTF